MRRNYSRIVMHDAFGMYADAIKVPQVPVDLIVEGQEPREINAMEQAEIVARFGANRRTRRAATARNRAR